MKIALMHFHLNIGGVTAVVRRQAELLGQAGMDVLLFSGVPPQVKMPAPVAVVPGLRYDRVGQPPAPVAETIDQIQKALRGHWPSGGADLLHVHNPTLGKNRQLQSILKHLQRGGLPLLCQIHDFAEDGRPDLYFAEPYVADCHYAVLNGRDQRLLREAGLCAEGLHLLPNTVALPPPPVAHGPHPAETYSPSASLPGSAPVLYPVRAIRRKNIGEAILLRLFMEMDAPLAITLPPTNPADLPAYRSWQAFVRRHRLPIVFDAGVNRNYPRLLAGCRFTVTTSITEGFGFTFVEPWLAGKPLWGRLLPDICEALTARGLRLDHLYPALAVPLSWLDADGLRRRWQHAMLTAARRCQLPLAPMFLDRAWDAASASGSIDFGLLDEALQQSVIQRLLADGEARQTLALRNPFLKSPGPPASADAMIRHNRDVVRRHFNPAAGLARLLEVYRQVTRATVRHAIDKQVLLRAFFAPERFSLLKWSTADG